MELLKAGLKEYFKGYEAHQERSGSGDGKPAIDTDQLAELIVNARYEASEAIEEAPEKPLTKKEKKAAAAAAKDAPANDA